MKYIICEQPGNFQLKEKQLPVRGSGEALLKIKKIGICGTDLHAYRGNQAFFSYPRILGHELAAEVLEIDPNEQGIEAGDRVVIIPYVHCKSCLACRSGKTNCCTSLKVLGVHTDGGMQERICVPAELIVPTNKLSYDEMVIVEPLSIGAHAIRRAALKPGETIVVMGCGPIGLGLMKLAKIAGVRVIALDVDQSRLKFAKDKIDVDHVVVANNMAQKEITAITGGNLATAVFDASGHRGALEAGPTYMAHGGRYIMVGLSKGEITFNHPAIHAREITIMCSRNATLEDFKEVIAILEKKAFPTDSFITHQVDFMEMIAHFNKWLDPSNGVIKAIVNFNTISSANPI